MAQFGEQTRAYSLVCLPPQVKASYAAHSSMNDCTMMEYDEDAAFSSWLQNLGERRDPASKREVLLDSVTPDGAKTGTEVGVIRQ